MINIRKNSLSNDVVFQMNTFGKVVVFSDANVKRDKELNFFSFEGGPAFKVGKQTKFGKMNWKINKISEHKMGYNSDRLNSVILDVTPLYDN